MTMAVQDTSLEAWMAVEPSLGSRQQAVLDTIALLKLATNMEISKALGWSINRVTPRVKELRDRGYVSCAGRKQCEITGREVLSWEKNEVETCYRTSTGAE